MLLCIDIVFGNLLKKENGIGLVGGITVGRENEIKPYLDYVIREHKKRNPEVNVVDSYVGLKRELMVKKAKRNYLYHINQHSNNIWSVVLGKFTLAFSLGPEFFRRVYSKNPVRNSGHKLQEFNSYLISKTSWKEIVDKNIVDKET